MDNNLPDPATILQLASQLFPDEKFIGDEQILQTLVWLNRLHRHSAGGANIGSKEESRSNGYHSVSVEPPKAQDEDEVNGEEQQPPTGTYRLEEPIDVPAMMEKFVSHVRKNKISASSLVNEIEAAYPTILNWLKGAQPRGDSIGRIAKYMARVEAT